MCVLSRSMDAATQMLYHDETITQFGVEDLVRDLKHVETLTQTQQQPQDKKTHIKKPTIRLTIRTVLCAPKGLFFTDYWTRMKSSQRQTLSNKTVDMNHLRLVNQQVQLKSAEMFCLIDNPHEETC